MLNTFHWRTLYTLQESFIWVQEKNLWQHRARTRMALRQHDNISGVNDHYYSTLHHQVLKNLHFRIYTSRPMNNNNLQHSLYQAPRTKVKKKISLYANQIFTCHYWCHKIKGTNWHQISIEAKIWNDCTQLHTTNMHSATYYISRSYQNEAHPASVFKL